MKRTECAILAIVAMSFASHALSGDMTGDDQWAVGALGTTDGTPITNGFVFIDGAYIDPPYVVTRRGNGVFVNGHLAEQPCPWPIPERVEPVIPIDDPKMPETITRDTTRYDEDLIAYLGKKKAYYLGKHGEKGMISLMIEVYQALPCVVKAGAGRDEEHISVTWVDGTTMEHRIILPKRMPMEWTREKVLERTDKARANYEDRLKRGDYYFLGSVHGRMTGTADGARMVLGALVPILRTSKDAKEVQERMAKAGFVWFDDRAAQAFFSNRSDSKGLGARVEKLSEGNP